MAYLSLVVNKLARCAVVGLSMTLVGCSQGNPSPPTSSTGTNSSTPSASSSSPTPSALPTYTWSTTTGKASSSAQDHWEGFKSAFRTSKRTGARTVATDVDGDPRLTPTALLIEDAWWIERPGRTETRSRTRVPGTVDTTIGLLVDEAGRWASQPPNLEAEATWKAATPEDLALLDFDGTIDGDLARFIDSVKITSYAADQPPSGDGVVVEGKASLAHLIRITGGRYYFNSTGIDPDTIRATVPVTVTLTRQDYSIDLRAKTPLPSIGDAQLDTLLRTFKWLALTVNAHAADDGRWPTHTQSPDDNGA